MIRWTTTHGRQAEGRPRPAVRPPGGSPRRTPPPTTRCRVDEPARPVRRARPSAPRPSVPAPRDRPPTGPPTHGAMSPKSPGQRLGAGSHTAGDPSTHAVALHLPHPEPWVDV